MWKRIRSLYLADMLSIARLVLIPVGWFFLGAATMASGHSGWGEAFPSGGGGSEMPFMQLAQPIGGEMVGGGSVDPSETLGGEMVDGGAVDPSETLGGEGVGGGPVDPSETLGGEMVGGDAVEGEDVGGPDMTGEPVD